MHHNVVCIASIIHFCRHAYRRIFVLFRRWTSVVLALPAKSQCYITEPFRDAEWDALRGNIPNGVLNNSDGKTGTLDGNALPGITVFNVPIGEEGFVKGYLEQKKNKIT